MSTKPLIEKIITSSNLPCPEFTFENPLLDKKVADTVSKSFVKIYNLSRQPNQNTKVNYQLRLSILENIRKMCQVEPENHMKVDEDVTSLLTEAYQQLEIDGTSKILDEFLIRNMKDLNINSNHDLSLNPEILQALINLNENGIHLKVICKDIIHWNSENIQNINIFKDFLINGSFIDEVCIKLKPELELILLTVCLSVLSDANLNIEDLFTSNADLKNLVVRSADSASCFQMCSGILNSIFRMTSYAPRIQNVIKTFVENVKQNYKDVTISMLYPPHIRVAALSLDFDIEQFPEIAETRYTKELIRDLSEIQTKSEDDVIMLLSHYPQWFDIYANKDDRD